MKRDIEVVKKELSIAASVGLPWLLNRDTTRFVRGDITMYVVGPNLIRIDLKLGEKDE